MTTGRQLVWQLSAVEFDVLWREFGRGLPPYPLELPSPGTTYGERAEIVAEVWAGLVRRGVVRAGRARRLPPDLDSTLTLLDTGEVIIDGLIDAGGHVCLLAGRDGAKAALVVQRGEEVLLRATMDAARLPGTIIELLPNVRPAQGRPVQLPYSVLASVLAKLAKGETDGSEFKQELRGAGVSPRHVRWIAGLAQGEQSNGVQFGVNIKGSRVGVLSWYATEQGGVLVTRQKAAGGDWVTITPSDATGLVGRLDELAGGRRA